MAYLTQGERDTLERLQSKDAAPPETIEAAAKVELEGAVREAQAQGWKLAKRRAVADDEFTVGEIANQIMRRGQRVAAGEVRWDDAIDQPTLDPSVMEDLPSDAARRLRAQAKRLTAESRRLSRQQELVVGGEIRDYIEIQDPETGAVVTVPGSPSFLAIRNAQAIALHRKTIATFNQQPAAALAAAEERAQADALREAVREKRAQVGAVGVD